jgi:hypothetical protein
MKMNGGNRGYRLGVRIAIAASLLGGFGCGSAELESEPVGQTTEAVSIGDWNGLVGMGTSGTYTLTENINATGKTWTPKDFSGTFDGGGKTISNLTINVEGDAGFFRQLTGATVRNVKFTGLRVTGTWLAGGLVAYAADSTLERIVVDNGTITTNNGWAVAGIAAYMAGGTLTRSYAKGTVNGSPGYAAGGLVAGLWLGNNGSRGEITESYSQVNVDPSAAEPTRPVYAGGIVGRTFAGRIGNVYHVGNVTGRGGVGGLVGYLSGDSGNVWLLYNSISRGGDVTDKDKSGGWEGTVGVVSGVNNRFSLLFYDAEADPTTGPNTSYTNSPASQHGVSTNALKSPTTPSGGVFCVGGGSCGDGFFTDPPWNAGSASEHHVLRNMPGPNIQPR